MPEYLAPGVYVEEVSGGIKPIEGVATSTAGFAGGTERGPTTPPQLVTSWSDYIRRFGGFIDDSFLPFAVKGFFDNGGQRCYIARVVGDGAGDPAAVVLDGADGGIRLEAHGQGAWGNRLFVRIDDPSRPRRIPVVGGGEQLDPSQFQLTLLYYDVMPPLPLVDPLDPENDQDPNRREPAVIEQFDNLGVNPLLGGYIENVLNNQSNLVRTFAPDGGYGRPANVDFTELTNGTDGTIDATAIIGDVGVPTEDRTGLAALELVDQISILCVPDEVLVDDGIHRSLIRNALVQQCNRTKDRFVLLHLPLGYSGTDTDPGGALGELPDTTRAAVYHPWVRVFDPRYKSTRLVPPGGFVAGVYARTDIERGVHKAPANEVVRGIILADQNSDRPLSVIYTKGQQEILNPRGINLIRDFRSDRRGIRIWGARTISSDPEWKYVNVRRLFLFVEESIDEGTQWVVFEPNHEPTWAKVRRSITNFLTSVWRSGALMGVTQDEAFYVKCDRTTMTQDDIDNGRLICLIGIAPVKPAEFVIFRISQKTLEATG